MSIVPYWLFEWPGAANADSKVRMEQESVIIACRSEKQKPGLVRPRLYRLKEAGGVSARFRN